MSKTRDTGNITNVIKVDATGNVSFVSGSTTLATISTSGQMSGSLPALSSSYALSASYVTNAETLDGLDSTVFTLTSSFNTTSASLYTVSSSAYATSGSLSATSGSLSATSGSLSATSGSLSAASGSLSATSGSLSAASGSLSAASGSFNTRVNALEITGSALSSSILSVSASLYSTSGSLSSASGSFNTRISTVESKYATTGSNTFIGTQIISGSILQSGSFTSTGTLTAQTLVVQTITSSVVYSSGSNIFGNSLDNSQVFTGSVLITGSLTISTGGNASAPTIFGSTIACSPIGCFATSCATAFIGGTMSGTTIYGSTAVCSPIGLFNGCVGIGASINPAYMLEVSSTGGSQRIRVGTLQNNDNTPRFEAITSNGISVANSAWLKVNDAGGFTLGQSDYTKAGGDSGNFACLSSETEYPRITVTTVGNVLIGSTSALNSEKFGVLMSSNCSVSTVKAVARFSNDGSGYIPKILLTDNNIADATISFIPAGAGTSTLSFGIQGACVGYQYLNIKENGNVLIGKTTNAGGKLQVSNGTVTFNVDHNADGPYLTGATDNNVNYKKLSYDACEHIFLISATEKMRITSAGYVGIGISSPTTLFHICQTGQPATPLELYSTMTLQTDSQANYQRIRFDRDGCAFWGLGVEGDGSSNDFMLSGLVGGKTAGTWSDCVFRIKNSNGFMAMGNKNPQFTIDLSSDDTTRAIQFYGGTGTDKYGIGKFGGSGATTVFHGGAGASNRVSLGCYNGTTYTPNFEVLGNGVICMINIGSGAGTYPLKWNSSTKNVTYDTSSERYKNNIRNSIYGLSDIMKLNSKMFEYKDTGRTDIGLIAEEVYLIIPELVLLDENSLPNGVSYDRMVSILTRGMQEQQCTINTLKTCLGIT